MQLDLDGDHLLFDGLESVTVKEKTGTQRSNAGIVADTVIDTAVSNCLRREITERESIDSGGRLLAGDVFWEVWQAELPAGFEMTKAMTIIPDNNLQEIWDVLAVDYSTIKRRWRCHCRK